MQQCLGTLPPLALPGHHKCPFMLVRPGSPVATDLGNAGHQDAWVLCPHKPGLCSALNASRKASGAGDGVCAWIQTQKAQTTGGRDSPQAWLWARRLSLCLSFPTGRWAAPSEEVMRGLSNALSCLWRAELCAADSSCKQRGRRQPDCKTNPFPSTRAWLRPPLPGRVPLSPLAFLEK